MVTVEISGRLPARFGRERAGRVVNTAYRLGGGKGPAVVSVTIVDDRAMRRLNRRHRGKDRPTDVLSFPFDGSAEPFPRAVDAPRTLGEIVISLPTVRRQAATIGRTVGGEFALMLAHGTLHLLGYDHETASQEQRMFGLQHEALIRAGML